MLNNKDQIYIRVGEKNNFNHTPKEYTELDKKWIAKGKCFVNSNAYTRIDNKLPSIITLNPNLLFIKPTGKLDNIKAFRVKIVHTNKTNYMVEQSKCFHYAQKMNIPVLITLMRFKRKKTLHVYADKTKYKWEKNYFRPIHKDEIIKGCKRFYDNVYICDESGNGCPSCNNCTKLTYKAIGTIKALNLSISGIKDKNGKQGICPYNCVDCWSKIVTYGKSPATDKLITNKKITGDINK